MSTLELFGYLASALVAASLTMSSIVKLRWVNMAGAGLFTAYGFLIDALPVAFLNGYIVLINIYYLYGIYRRTDRFHLLEARLGDPLVQHWLDFYQKDIERNYPGLGLDKSNGKECTLLLRNSEPVGLLVGSQQDSTYDVTMDYVFPAYQDFKTGHYLYRESGFFNNRNINRVTTHSDSERHQAYLARMGFVPAGDKPGAFELRLAED